MKMEMELKNECAYRMEMKMKMEPKNKCACWSGKDMEGKKSKRTALWFWKGKEVVGVCRGKERQVEVASQSLSF